MGESTVKFDIFMHTYIKTLLWLTKKGTEF